MEIEYKWKLAPEEDVDVLLSDTFFDGIVFSKCTIQMNATYYDTLDKMFSTLKGALRLRKENANSVCCMKLLTKSDSNLKIRQEYEVNASSIKEGLKKLPLVGAPKEICNKALKEKLDELCKIVFIRDKYTFTYRINEETCTMELDFDTGKVFSNGKSSSINEIELEYINGQSELFHEFAQKMQRYFSLEVQTISKMAQAFALNNDQLWRYYYE